MQLVKKLILEIIDYFENNIEKKSDSELLTILKHVSLERNNYKFQEPNIPPKLKALKDAMLSIETRSLLRISQLIDRALPKLKWNIDNGTFYERDSKIGKDYLDGNMNSELIGPEHGIFKSDQCRLGLFLLEPNIFYKDHKHETPELYLNLTNGTQWRFENLEWQEKAAGSLVFNESYKVHAMNVKSNPFLSIWYWPVNSEEKCILVPKSDW